MNRYNRQQGNPRNQGAITAAFTFDQNPVGPNLMTTIMVKRGENPIPGTQVTVTKMVQPYWERTLHTNSKGQATFLVPLDDTEDALLFTAQVAIGGSLINVSDTWNRPIIRPRFANHLRVNLEPTDSTSLVYLQVFTTSQDNDEVGVPDFVHIICQGKKIVGGDVSDSEGGDPRNELTLFTDDQGRGQGWVRLEEVGEGYITVCLAGGRKPFTFKLKNEVKGPAHTVSKVHLQSDFTISPVFVKIHAELAKPGKAGECKLVSTANINAEIVGGPRVCENTQEGKFTTDIEGNAQLKLFLPEGVQTATVHIESVAEQAVRSRNLVITAHS